jgi:hypothetical protein
VGEEIFRTLDLKAYSSKCAHHRTNSEQAKATATHFISVCNAKLYSTNHNLYNDNIHNCNCDKIILTSPRVYYEFRSKCRDFESLSVCDLYIVFPTA